MSRVGLAAAVIVAASLAVPACSAPGAASAPTSASGPAASPSGAPRVASPLNPSRFLAEPCSVLSTAQLARFGIGAAGVTETDAGPGCTWRADGDHPRGFQVIFLTGDPHGLADTYRNASRAFPGYFLPTEVDGYPAVFTDRTDFRAAGVCSVTVGISDTLAFRATESATIEVGTQSCEHASQLATEVIRTLKGGG